MKAMKFKLNVLIAFMLLGLTYSCFDDGDDNTVSASGINDFVWKGMNAVYLYKDNIPNLSNDRFSSNSDYANYLNSFSTPEELFESLIYQRQTVDRFSWIVDDYIALEQLFSGVTTNNGMEFSLFFVPNSTTEVFGVVRLILPNSEADNNNLRRGDIFYAIDGTPLTESNFSNLLNQDSYTINLGTFNDNGTPTDTTDDTIDSGTENVMLNKVAYTENPVFKTNIFNVGGANVGYLMYNGFTSNFDSQLNAAFGDFATNNVQQLVLDLRYNPGGSVNTASLLGSMVTGQFNEQVFAKLQYNNDLQSNNSIFNFTNSVNSSPLNSLNLSKIYVLTTGRSASASEMVINSLSAYITVVQIGANTTGKSQASITVYDSPNLQRDGANPNHTYAMQPLVAITVNKNDAIVPSSGLIPTIELAENPFNYGILGDANEPLLAAALADILGSGRISYPILPEVELLGDSNDFLPFDKGGMIIDNKFPIETLKKLLIN
jgi:C-terminal processing protease CtpA/Prc